MAVSGPLPTPAERLERLASLGVQSLVESLPGIAYVVAPDGAILAYGRASWDHFAIENQALGLADPECVLGHSLFDFMAGGAVRRTHREMLARVLRSGEPLTYDYRCDAPGLRRFMRMTLTALPPEAPLAVMFHSEVLHTEERPTSPLLARTPAQTSPDWPILTVCAYCREVRNPPAATEGEWMSVERYEAVGGPRDVRLSHGVCPPCFERLMSLL